MTRSHDDRIKVDNTDYGYSIRVGSVVPTNAVNLAYVHTPEIMPKRNLQITDMTDKIVENQIRDTVENEKMVFPGDDFLLRELTRPYYSASKNLVLTDEFSIPSSGQETPMALYYQAEAKGLFDARGAMVAYYPGGYVEKTLSTVVDYSQIDQARVIAGEPLLYAGNKIKITRADGSALPSQYKYKIQLVKQIGVGIPDHAYRVIVFTNFRGDGSESFLLRYEKFNLDQSHTSDMVEVLNAYPFFTEVSKESLDLLAENPKANGQWKPDLGAKQFAVHEDDGNWEVYAPSQVLIADNGTRPAQQFRYKIKGKLNTKMNAANPGSINIGLIYLNETVFGAEDFTLVLKKIYNDGYKPQYLDFQNPHPPALMTKTDDKYWTIDMTMPADYLNDYDLIILSGFGAIDMASHNDALRTYLQNGGRIWIDNAGTGSEVFTLSNFLTSISFSSSQEIGGLKVYGIPDSQLGLHSEYSLERKAAERLYNLKKIDMSIGYPNINPKILFGTGEDASLWQQIVAYQSGEPSVITRKIYDDGTLIVSNCGVFRSLANRTSEDIKMAMNLILAIAEEKSVTTPWLRDYVYHRENLFAEEYKIGDLDLYVDDRSDVDTTQIVAKKIMNKSMRDALIPYMPSSYYKAKGTFKTEVEADNEVVVTNNDFEVGTEGVTNNYFSGAIANVIPGWSTVVGSGTTQQFQHGTSISERGARAVSIKSTGVVRAHWATSQIAESLYGTYRASVWVKAAGITGVGAKMAIYRTNGTLIAESDVIVGTRDWTKINIVFGTTTPTDIQIRLGFLDESAGQVWFDYVQLVSVGAVYMTPENNGDIPLYAYSVRPNGNIFDLKTQGFVNADVTVYDPVVQFYALIRSFIYKWDNTLVRYVREYGNFSRTLVKVRRSDGTVNIGALTALVPDLKAGAGWADKTKVFFELNIEPVAGDSTSDFVNVAFFNTGSGRYYFSEFGENIIGFTELYDAQSMRNIVVQAWTDYYTIRATKRRYSVKPVGDERIYLEYPATIEERAPWFPRVHNGNFVKKALNFNEYDAFKDLLAGRQFGTHRYSLPEYDRQLFKPGQPYRKVRKEVVEYVNDTTVKLQHTPMYVQIGSTLGERGTEIGTGKLIYRASKGNWLKTPAPKVYVDNNGDNFFSEYVGDYDIDYMNGIVYLADTATGVIKMDYSYNNLELFKRTYANSKIKKEQFQTVDKKTFYSSAGRKNWLLYPAPVVYRIPYGADNNGNYIAPVNTYRIDYDNGTIEFIEDVNDRIHVDYTYTVDRPLSIRDYDVNSGLLYLNGSITFKDEVYCNYYYEENYVEYRGYYDEETVSFMHLDLNPSEGHYCTMSTVRTDPNDSSVVNRFEKVPTAKLMNKEVYIYLLPHSDSFGNLNQYTIRHCFSKAEWDKISKTKLGTAQLLGIVQIREHTKVTEATVLDTRTRGGGLKESISKDLMKKTDPLTASYWDMGSWEGQAYYSNGVVVIELPRSILVGQGGQFTEKDVEDAIRKYIAYGTYFIVEYV
jgi:3-isopropylmalate dehydratase small subunit